MMNILDGLALVCLIAVIWNVETVARIRAAIRLRCRPTRSDVEFGDFEPVCQICGCKASVIRSTRVMIGGTDEKELIQMIDLCRGCSDEATEFSNANMEGLSE